MKRNFILAGLGFMSALCLHAFAAPLETKSHSAFSLDHAHNIVFEQLPYSTFTLGILQAKNQFDSGSIIIGGMAELDWQGWHGDKILAYDPIETYHTGHDVYFTQVIFDVLANINNWSMVYLSTADTAIGQGGENGNYIYYPNAFVLFGNLDKFPLYITAGVSSVPFGQFVGTGTWDLPLTTDYFYPQQSPELIAAFHKYNIDLIAAVYRDQVLFKNHAIYAANYQNTKNDFSYSLGVGYLTDLNLNTTGRPQVNRRHIRAGSGFDAGGVHDVNFVLGYKQASITGEYVSGTRHVANNHHYPNAWSVLLSYAPTIRDATYTFGFSYSKTNHLRDVPATLSGQDQLALAAVGLKNAWALSAYRVFFNNWLQVGLDAEHDTTYNHEKTQTYTCDLIVYL